MAELKLDYYKGEDLYSDGDVENEILELVRGKGMPAHTENIKFPVLYHLSNIRENILNWYPFKKEGTGLEIGSGCGAITGLLCSRLSHVVSADLSKRRAEINYTRHKELSNLEIWVGNLNDMDFGRQFDYVIINGVFEYAMSFTEGETPYETFLNKISRFLKPGGIILIAIENRLGLKYFAGAPEDHTDGYFDGIREYEGNRSVRTFSRGEWEDLMKTCRFDYYRFYYPYPDYKFPREIFTDESLKEQKYGTPAWNFTKYRMALFQENRMAAALQREGIMGHFANSFLIEMSRVPLDKRRRAVYAKMSTDRAERFSIATVIEEREAEKDSAATMRKVIKAPMRPAAAKHMDNLLSHMEDYGSWRPLAGEMEGEQIVYPFLKQQSLGGQAREAVADRDIDRLKKLVDQVEEICRNTKYRGKGGCLKGRELTEEQREQFSRVFGDGKVGEDMDCVMPANIDLILDNIFEADGTYQVIDCEWVFDFPVPVSFILWRTINELYTNYPHLEEIYEKEQFFRDHQITGEMSRCFWKWATFFAENYVGANGLLKWSIPEIGVSLEEFRQRIRSGEIMTSQLFVDTGKGFSEEEKLVAETDLLGGHFALHFALEKFGTVRSLRFDPLEGKPCICRIDPKKTSVKLIPVNAASTGAEGDLFLTTDPIYQVKGTMQGQSLSIVGEIEVLSMEDALNRAGLLLQKGRKWSRFTGRK